ncbi:trigger factor [Hydrogenovibrio marinus]|uniref:Trigger factor n=1 Tax=Hydrogenovibrio marinus TaxID=28885 RepID=A0A066ZYD6_HYDMR|nr:trigger factor [Hydrogenovibrio marinus]KDN95115.1 trigger factor [Hydrogenovibrio marinus]BBN59588.1 trigger factor [Hydrogenovibrio marinus]
MQVTVEKPKSGLEHKITVVMPSGDLDSKVEKRLAEMRRNVKMDGFRPGKVPMSVVKKRYGGQVRQELMGDAVQQSFYEAVTKEELNVAGYPMFDSLDEKDGSIEFTARFEIFPEVKLPDLAKLKVDSIQAEVADKDVDNMLNKLLEQKMVWQPSKSAAKKAKKGEQVIIDFVGKKDGVAFDRGSAENVPLVLGGGQMIPGFEDGIIGMKKGEEKVIEVTFPEDYHSEELKGQTVTFDITVHSIQTKVVPEMDEEFVKSFGIEEGTEEALRTEIRSNMEKELSRAVDSKNRTAVFDALSDAVKIELPKSAVEQEASDLMQRQAQNFQQQGIKPEDVGLTIEAFMSDAETRVKLGLVLGDIIKENKIEATEADRKAYIEEQASSYEDPQQVIEWYAKNPQAQREIDSLLVEKQVASLILGKAKVKEVKKSFDDVVNQAG